MIASRSFAGLNYAFSLAMAVVIAAILTTALVMQFGYGELPCPLCLLQRVAMFGIAFGAMQNFRERFSYQNDGISLLFAVFLLIVASRQTLLDIYPRPGHEYIGTAILGLHMPVWSILIAAAALLAYAVKLVAMGGDSDLPFVPVAEFPAIKTTAGVVGAYLIALCAVNLVSVIVQCGFGECHTMGYKLLQ